MFLEYYNDPKATESASEDVWFKTGDLLRAGENGSMYFLHRLKDIIKVGGENVGVDELEKLTLQLNGVKEVAVVAKHDPALQEIPAAFVVPKRPAQQDEEGKLVLNHCGEHVSRFNIPRMIRVVDGFPRSLLNRGGKKQIAGNSR